MGQSFSQVQDDPELRKIYHSMQERLGCREAKMYIEAMNDECLPIVCAVDKFREYLFGVKFDTDERLKATIKSKLLKHLSGSYLEDLLSLVTGVLESVLTPSMDKPTGEEHEVQQIHVVYANRSVLRIDYFVYWQNYGDLTALCFYVQVGVIDMERVRLPVLIYELTRATKESQLGEVGEKLKKIAESTIFLNEAAQTLIRAARGQSAVHTASQSPSPAPGPSQVTVSHNQGNV